jgi:hypothetical protein
MRERDVETYFVRRVKEAGGLQRKFVSPGHRGVPDRIVVYFGDVYFVELKAPGKDLRPDQSREHDRLFAAGAGVWVAASKGEVDTFIEFITR